ncbi:MAG: hypothetical protein ACRC6M_03860 [Microcystaceae cyanobacterium]
MVSYRSKFAILGTSFFSCALHCSLILCDHDVPLRDRTVANFTFGISRDSTKATMMAIAAHRL